ncbi:MAG: AsmA family protein [Ehrlichia sp.]
MRVLVYCGGIILVFLLFLVISPFFINWNSYYASHVLKRIEGISSNISVKGVGDVTGTLIMPKIVISNLYIEGHDDSSTHKSTILVDRLELKVSWLSLLLFSPQVDEVTIDGLNIPLGNFLDLLYAPQHKKFNVKTFNIVNSVVNTHHDGTSFNSKPISIKSGAIKTVHNTKVVNGLLNLGKTDYKLVVDLLPDGEQYRVDANVYSNATKVTLSGVANDNKFDGLILANGSDFAEFINDISETNKTSIFSFINSHEKFSLSTNISLVGKAFKLSDFKVATDSVEGSGVLACSSYSSCNANINFSKVDVDSLSSSKGNIYNEKESRTLDYFNTLVSKDLNYNIKLSARKIKYRNQVSSNLILNLEVFEGKVNVNKVTVTLPGNGNVLHVEGNVASSDLISSFNGKLKVVGNDFYSFVKWLFPVEVDLQSDSNGFSIESDLYIAPRVFSLSNLAVLTDSFGDAKGQLKVKYDKKSGFVTGNIEVRDVDFDRYHVNEELNMTPFMSMKWLKKYGIYCKV